MLAFHGRLTISIELMVGDVTTVSCTMVLNVELGG